MKKKMCKFSIILLIIFLLSGVCMGLKTSDNSDLGKFINSEDQTLTTTFTDEDKVELPFTENSKTPVIRYPNKILPVEIKEKINYIDFQKDTSNKGQTYIYFKIPAGTATVNQSQKIASYIINRDEWIGDRSLDSIAAEIYIHWVADNAEPLFQNNPFAQGLWKQLIIGEDDNRPSPVHPTHLGYKYAGLDKSNPMDAFLLTL